jgi:membrane-associated phospholipid phosphatase
LEYNEDEAGKYLKESSKYIMELKYKFQRPRPHQIADFYGIDLNGVDLDSMKTPSYPSGHATQGYLLGMIYSERYPEYRKEFMKLGEDIAESRIVGKAHFPSDKKAGIELAEKLFQNRK